MWSHILGSISERRILEGHKIKMAQILREIGAISVNFRGPGNLELPLAGSR